MKNTCSTQPPSTEPCQSSPLIACLLADWELQLFFPTGLPLSAVTINPKSNEGELESVLEETQPAALLIGWSTPPLPEPWLSQPACPVRYICNVTGSLRRVVPRAFIERGGWATNWSGLCAQQVAEHALMLALSAARNLPAWSEFMDLPYKERYWPDLKTCTLFDRKVGIHGFGQVAQNLTRLLQPFGVRIQAYSQGVPDRLMLEAGVTPASALEALVEASEVFFECEALTPQTENCLNASLLAKLPNDAIFVNVGRGKVAAEEALIAEAQSGRIRVAVDVCESEPHYANSPILKASKVIVSPHIAGPTVDRTPAIGQRASQNLTRFLQGDCPEGLIDLENYDRST